MKQIYHKKNELQEVEFFKDKECTEAFDFKNAKDLYVQGGIATLIELSAIVEDCNIYIPFLQKTKYYTLSAISFVLNENKNTLYTISETNKFTDGTFYNSILENIKTITPNLSKYIPKDNAVLFLNGEKISLIDYDIYYDMFDGYRDIEFEGKIIKGMPYHPQIYGIHRIRDMVYIHKHEYNIDDYTNFSLNILKGKKLTIFLSHLTQAELQKANEVGKYLWENFGIKPDLFGLHWFGSEYKKNSFEIEYFCQDFGTLKNINKIITTNSAGILKPEDSNERLQVIDCKEIFEEYLKTER